MLYAASLPKIAILLGAFVEIEQGEMKLDTDTRESLTRMIRVSSNADATRMLNRVGKQRLLGMLQSRKFDLYDPKVNGGLWVGKEYGKSAAYKRDPLHNLSHGATAMQTARFYYMLETGKLVGPRLTREMKSMLGNPGIHHKFVKGLADYPDAKIYRKSGSWRQWHADSAIVEAQGHKYIIVALAESPNGGAWLSRLIQPIHQFMVPTRLASTGN
jgi:beta-lactamase class A